MQLLSSPFESQRVRSTSPIARPLLAAGAAMAGLMSAGLLLEVTGSAAPMFGRALQGTAAHGGFVTVGFLVAFEGDRRWRGPAVRVTLVLLAAFVASRFEPWGSAAFLAAPLALVRECRREPALARVGAGGAPAARAVLLGLATGAFLGLHLLICAALTFGYVVRVTSLGAYLAAVAYDAGANALSAEWLFRGALFSHWWRQWGFWPAAGLSTATGLIRYLLDPALPRAVEVGAGAVFYLALLGLAACGLRKWSGSLVPGYLATLGFFAVYRTLAVG